MNTKVFGSICLVAGTTIGASMLALSMTSAQIGFVKSCVLLGVIWAFMVLSAGLMVDLSEGKSQSIATIAGTWLGDFAKRITGATLMLLFWSLLAAYMAGGSSILHQLFPSSSQRLLALGYGLLFGTVVLWKAQAVDMVNRFLMFIKMIVFMGMLLCITPYIERQNLFGHAETLCWWQSSSFYQSVPIFFAAFGFHGSIPSLVKYLDGNRSAIYKSLIIGSLIPLFVYILWQAITLGILDATTIKGLNGSIGDFMDAMTQKVNNPWLSMSMKMFSFLAITTSFLGVGLGLFDYVQEWKFFAPRVLSTDLAVQKKCSPCIVRPALITFSVPMIFALFYPQGFVYALGFAAMALSLFAVVIPSLAAMKAKGTIKGIFMHPLLTVVLLLGGILVILIESFRW